MFVGRFVEDLGFEQEQDGLRAPSLRDRPGPRQSPLPPLLAEVGLRECRPGAALPRTAPRVRTPTATCVCECVHARSHADPGTPSPMGWWSVLSEALSSTN